MPEETKCPKCGAEETHDCEICKSFKCDSTLFKDGTFNQAESCELATLRAALSKAVEALKDSVATIEGLSAQQAMDDPWYVPVVDELKTTISTLSTLTRAENGDL